MNDSSWLFLFIILGLDSLLVLVRASYIHVRVPHLITLREQDHHRVERTLKLLEQPTLPAGLRVSVVFMHLTLGMTSWVLLVDLLKRWPALWVLLLTITLLGITLMIIEFTLEGLVLRNPEQWALRLSALTRLIDLLLRPLTIILIRLLGPMELLQHGMGSVTEDELRIWVQEGQKEGSLEQGERKMIYSIFHFSDTLCREIMVPRIDVFALEASTSLPEAVQSILLSGHSRVPVYEETADNIIGLVYAKDLLRLHTSDEEGIQSLRDLLRPVAFVPEAKKVDELLKEMQERGVHMVVVVDEYGGTAGLVTLEDIVEEIVGEIRDEYDQSEELLYLQVSPEEFLFHGRIDLDSFNELLDTHLTKDVADTLGGYVYSEIGRVPTGGEKLSLEGWDLTVEQVSGRRIRRVRASRQLEQEQVEESKDESER